VSLTQNIALINVTAVKAMASKLFRESRLPRHGQFLIVLSEQPNHRANVAAKFLSQL